MKRNFMKMLSVAALLALAGVAGASTDPSRPGTDAEISKYLQSRDPLYSGYAPPTQQIIKRWAAFIEAYAAALNQPEKVIGKLVATGPNDFVVQFRTDAPLPAVARVEFTGNEAIDEPTLQNSIGAVAFGLPYTEQNFRELLDNQLRPMYEAAE